MAGRLGTTVLSFSEARVSWLVPGFLFLTMLPLFLTGHYRNPLNKYIYHYEGLSYDTEFVHSKHQRAKRALSHEDKFLHLEFHAHGRFVSFSTF